MRLKLKNEEMLALLSALKTPEQFTYLTKYEMKITLKVLRIFMEKRVKQMVGQKLQLSFELTEPECLALDYVLKQAGSNDPYVNAVITELRTKVNQLCLNI